MRLFALLTLTASLAAAQTPTTPQHALLEETQIHSGMSGQFESAQKEYCAAVVRGGAPACRVPHPTPATKGSGAPSFAHFAKGGIDQVEIAFLATSLAECSTFAAPL